LWCRAHHDPEKAATADELQLLDLSSLRRVVGLLQGEGRQRPVGARRDHKLFLGRQVPEVCAMQYLRVHHALGAAAVAERQQDWSQHEKH
jgi:hypothetical protein